jgi:KUP system potassium uptake protein
VLGSVFLALTGGEALYADMGHFGRRAIRIDWFALVMPALVLNYLGQGALVLADTSTAANPFFLLFPGWLLIPLVGLTTAATVIASQAVISSAFTLVQQAIQLGAVPRLEVRQTSQESAGQVYVPHINCLLVAAVLGLVFGFRSSDALANAYGIAVAGDVLVTSVLVATVARGVWRWPLHLLLPVAGLFLALDLTFVSANLHKIPDGGWFPLIVGAAALSLMLIWRRGRAVALAHRSADAMPLDAFLISLAQPGAPVRVPGTAVYLTTQHDLVPSAFALNLKHNGVLHERLVLLKVTTERAPRVSETARVVVEELSTGIRRVELRFGFAEKPDVPAALQAHAEEVGCELWVMLAWVFFRCDSTAQATEVLAAILGLRPHPGAVVLLVEGCILAIIGIDHTLGSARLRLSLSARWARALAWSGVGALFALGLAAMPVVQKPFIYFQF